MRFVCLASSSSGNCYYVELDRKDKPPVKLMLEAGLPYNEILSKFNQNGLNFSDVEAVLVTHTHMDHAKAVKELKTRKKRVYGNDLVTSGDYRYNLSAGIASFVAKDTKVIPFLVEHDAPDSLGFVITTGIETILFVNDCKYFSADLSAIQFDYIMIEANYDGQTIHFALDQAKKDNKLQDIRRYERLVDSHMSIKNTIEHLKRLNLTNCKAVFLMHLSDRHANENLFKQRVLDATGVKTFCCKKNGGLM